jgi:hypothetical protein
MKHRIQKSSDLDCSLLIALGMNSDRSAQGDAFRLTVVPIGPR